MGIIDRSAAVNPVESPEAKLIKARRENAQLQDKLLAMEKELEDLRKSSADSLAQTEKISELEAERASLLSRIEEIEASERVLKQQLVDESKAHAEEVAELKRIAEEARVASEKVEGELKAELQEKATALDEAVTEIEEKRLSIESLQEEKLLLQASIDSMESTGAEYSAEAERYKSMLAVAEERESKLKTSLATYEENVNTYAKQVAALTLEVAALKPANEELARKNAGANMQWGRYKSLWQGQKAKTDKALAQVKELTAKLKAAEKTVKETTLRLERATNLLARKDEKIAELQAQVASLKAEIEELKEENARLKEENASQKETIAAQEEVIAENKKKVATQTEKIQGTAKEVYDLERSRARAQTRVLSEKKRADEAEARADEEKRAKEDAEMDKTLAEEAQKQAEELATKLQAEIDKLLQEIGAKGGDFNVYDAVHRLVMTKFAEQYSKINLDEKNKWATNLYSAVESAKKADKKYHEKPKGAVPPEAGYEKIVDEIVLSYPLIIENASEASRKEFEKKYPSIAIEAEARKVVEDMIVKNMRKPKFFDEKGALKASALAAFVLALGSTGVYYGIADPQIQAENKAKRIEEQRTVITAIVGDYKETETTVSSATTYNEKYASAKDSGKVQAMSTADADEYTISYENIQEASELVNSIVELDEQGEVVESCLLGTAFVNYKNAVSSNDQAGMTAYANEIAEYQADIATCSETVKTDFDTMMTVTGYTINALQEAYNQAIQENEEKQEIIDSYETRDITVENTTDNAYQEFIEAFSSGKGTLKNIVVNYQASNGLVTITYDLRASDGKLSTNNVVTCTVEQGVANNNAVLALACQALGIEATFEVDSESEM